jgi:hypothetical protein
MDPDSNIYFVTKSLQSPRKQPSRSRFDAILTGSSCVSLHPDRQETRILPPLSVPEHRSFKPLLLLS